MNVLTRSEEEILFNQLKHNARINCAPLIQGIFFFFEKKCIFYILSI